MKRQVSFYLVELVSRTTVQTLLAPNYYAPEHYQIDTPIEYTFGYRTNIEPSSITPAPNSYAPEKVNLDVAPAYTMRPKTYVDKPNTIPAPNQYAPEKVNLDQGPAYTMRPKTAVEKPNTVPGMQYAQLDCILSLPYHSLLFYDFSLLIILSSDGLLP